MEKIIKCIVIIFAAVSLIYGLATGGDVNSPAIVLPMLLALVLALKSSRKKAR